MAGVLLTRGTAAAIAPDIDYDAMLTTCDALTSKERDGKPSKGYWIAARIDDLEGMPEGLDSIREYQLVRAATAVPLLRAGGSGAIVMATGTGKTRTSAAVVSCFRRTLWLCDRRELASQTIKALDGMGLVTQPHSLKAAGVYVTTVQSVRSIKPGAWDLIVVDECHGFITDRRVKLLQGADTPLLGLTATPRRGDNRGLDVLFGPDPICPPYTLSDGIQAGWLCDVQAKAIELHELGLEQMAKGNGDFSAKSLSKALNTEEHNKAVVERWLQEAVDETGKMMVTGFYCSDCQHADDLGEEIKRQAGDVVVVVHGKSTGLLSDFTSGKKRVCVSVGQLTEGFDHPAMRCLMIVRPTKSPRLYLQMVGRVLRLFQNKPWALVLDCVDATGTVDLANIYSLVSPDRKDAVLPLTKPREQKELVPDFGMPMMVSEIISRVQIRDIFARHIADQKHRHWHRISCEMEGRDVPMDALLLGPKEALVIAPTRDDPSVASLSWLRYQAGDPIHIGSRVATPHRAVIHVLAKSVPEAAAVAEAERWVSRMFASAGFGINDRKAAEKMVNQWAKDRRPPSHKMIEWLASRGVVLPGGVTHAQARKLRSMLSYGSRAAA
jgi:superfamily II DNA or RNA helicase